MAKPRGITEVHEYFLRTCSSSVTEQSYAYCAYLENREYAIRAFNGCCPEAFRVVDVRPMYLINPKPQCLWIVEYELASGCWLPTDRDELNPIVELLTSCCPLDTLPKPEISTHRGKVTITYEARYCMCETDRPLNEEVLGLMQCLNI